MLKMIKFLLGLIALALMFVVGLQLGSAFVPFYEVRMPQSVAQIKPENRLIRPKDTHIQSQDELIQPKDVDTFASDVARQEPSETPQMPNVSDRLPEIVFKTAEVPTLNIAVVNLKLIFQKSLRLEQAREEHRQQLDELSKWATDVNKDMLKVSDNEDLVKHYQKLATEKETIINREYDKKVEEIGAQITKIIEETAKEKGCDIVLSNTAVVIGGKNITEDVLQKMQ